MYTDEEIDAIGQAGWKISRNSPLEITDGKGSYASRKAAELIVLALLNNDKYTRESKEDENYIYVVARESVSGEDGDILLGHSGSYREIGRPCKAFRTIEDAKRIIGSKANFLKLEIHNDN